MKPIPNFPSYFADKLGNIYSTKPKNQNSPPRKPFPKTQTTNWQGYKCVALRRDGKANMQLVAVLVLETFVGPRPKGYYACHGVKGKSNNSLKNVYWATPKQNSADTKRDGTMLIGEKHPMSKLSNQDVSEIKRLAQSHLSYSEIARRFDVSSSNISMIVHGKRWQLVKV